MCESGGGRSGLPVPNNPHGFWGRKATLNSNTGLHAPNSSYGLCGPKAIFEEELLTTELRSRVKVEVAVLASPSLKILMVSAKT